jgi:hypothetical protein
MTKWLRADLHIHSALSPCADDEMTPNNIVNMATVLGLQVIAVTDHQAADNVPAIMQLAKRAGIICVPGIEVQTKEEVHLLVYFPECSILQAFAEQIQAHFAEDWPASSFFGRQLIMDAEDKVVGEHSALLLQSTRLSLDQVWQVATRWGGVCVPAHLDRPAFSLLSQLAFLPASLPVSTVEYSQSYCAEHGLPLDDTVPLCITSSDAHALSDMVTVGGILLHPELPTPHAICNILQRGDRDQVRVYYVG